MFCRLFLTIFSMLFSLGLLAQDYYSTITSNENIGWLQENFDYLGQAYFISTEACYFESNSFCGHISKINPDGSVTVIKELGEFVVGDANVVVSEGFIFLSGMQDSSSWLKKLNDNFEVVDSADLMLDHYYLNKMIQTENELVIIGASTSDSDENKGYVLKVKKSDFSLKMLKEIQLSAAEIKLYDIEKIDDENFVLLQNFQSSSTASNVLRIVNLDAALTEVSYIDTDILSSYADSEIELFDSNTIVVKTPEGFLTCFDLQGNILWFNSVQNIFQDFEILDFQCEEIRVNDSGDLMICGFGGRKDSKGEVYSSGFIIRISKDGNILWKKLYTPSENQNSYRLWGFTSIYEEENSFIFSGYNNAPNFFGSITYSWIIKTDQDGCIDPMYCSIDQVSTDEIETYSPLFNLLKNPIKDLLRVQFLKDGIHRYQILGFDGVILKQDKMQFVNLKLDLSNYPNGIYFIKVEFEGMIEVKKFVKW